MFTEFLVALQFLTIIRLRSTPPFADDTLGRSGVFFPVVGLLIGGIVWGLDYGLSGVCPAPLRNIVAIAVLIVLSRGLHLDGLADSADGLFGGTDAQHRLAIMKDSRIGTFGALALIGVVLMKVRALDLMPENARGLAFLLSPVLSRWACVVMAYAAPPARAEGLGALFIQSVHLRELVLSSIFTLAFGFLLVGLVHIVLLGITVALTLGVTRYCQRRLGGVTGDTLGAVGECIETAVFCCFATLASVSSGR